MKAMCESKSVASSEKSPFWLSQIPSASMLISRNFLPGFFGSRSGGKAARSWPISAFRELAPHSNTSASSAVMIAGRPQPRRSIGPATCLSRVGGKTVRSAARSRPAFAIGSCGKRIASSVWLRRPVAERVRVERAAEAEEPADPRERERPELQRRVELEREDDQERVALPAVRQPRRQQADRREREPAEVELEDARVLLLLPVEEEEAAAADEVALDADAEPARRAEAEVARVEQRRDQLLRVGGRAVAASSRGRPWRRSARP